VHVCSALQIVLREGLARLLNSVSTDIVTWPRLSVPVYKVLSLGLRFGEH
jgi:hypothetical protein